MATQKSICCKLARGPKVQVKAASQFLARALKSMDLRVYFIDEVAEPEGQVWVKRFSSVDSTASSPVTRQPVTVSLVQSNLIFLPDPSGQLLLQFSDTFRSRTDGLRGLCGAYESKKGEGQQD